MPEREVTGNDVWIPRSDHSGQHRYAMPKVVIPDNVRVLKVYGDVKNDHAPHEQWVGKKEIGDGEVHFDPPGWCSFRGPWQLSPYQDGLVKVEVQFDTWSDRWGRNARLSVVYEY